jgi:hypothetical protein
MEEETPGVERGESMEEETSGVRLRMNARRGDPGAALELSLPLLSEYTTMSFK